MPGSLLVHVVAQKSRQVPLQNRVTPFGDIIAASARGTCMGNRGIIHDPEQKVLLTRRWQHQAWLCCVLQFKEYQHPIMGPGSYTELFLLDEATALAAGHRPCAYCRRPAFNAFKVAWLSGNSVNEDFVPIARIDKQLHRERVTRRREKVTFLATIDDLPDGTMVAIHQQALLVWHDKLYPWQPNGYAAGVPRPVGVSITVLTPRSTVAAIEVGYRPGIHPSASS